MLYINFTEKLLGLQYVNITNVEESEKEIVNNVEKLCNRINSNRLGRSLFEKMIA